MLALASAGGRERVGAPVGDGLPDQLRHIDDEIGSVLTRIARCADLAGTDDIVQPKIGLAVGKVKH